MNDHKKFSDALLTLVAVKVARDVDAFTSHYYHFVSCKKQHDAWQASDKTQIYNLNYKSLVSDGSACEYPHGR